MADATGASVRQPVAPVAMNSSSTVATHNVAQASGSSGALAQSTLPAKGAAGTAANRMTSTSKLDELKSDAYSGKINVLKDKALYRFEREMNLHQFKELMNVFKEKSSEGGRLTIDQFKDEFAKILNKEMSEEQITLMLMRIGIRGNYVTWDSFSNFMLLRAQGASKQKESEEQETELFTPWPPSAFGKPIATPHREMICGLHFVDHLQRFATISRDATVCYWSEQFKLQRCFPSIVDAKAASTTTNTLATEGSIGAQATAHLKRSSSLTGAGGLTSSASQCWINDCCFMPDQRKWVFSTDAHELYFNDSATLKPQCRMALSSIVMSVDYFREENLDARGASESPSHRVHDAPGSAAAAVPEDHYVNDGILFLGDDQGEVTVLHMDSDSIFNPNGGAMLTAAKDKVYTLDKKWFRLAFKKRLHGDWISRIKYYHEFRCFFSVSPDPDASLVCGSVSSHKWKFTASSVNKGINVFAVCRFPVALVTGGADRSVRIWNPRRTANAQASLKGHAAPVVDIQVHQGLGLCLSMSTDKVVKVWDIRRQTCLQTISLATDILHRPENTFSFLRVVAGSKGTLRLFFGSSLIHELVMDSSARARQSTSHASPLRSVIYNPVCHMVVTLGDDSIIQGWDVNNGTMACRIDKNQVSSEVTCISFDEYSGHRRLLIGLGTGAILLSSIEGHVMCEMRTKERVEITSVAHLSAPEGRFVVAGGWRGRVYLYAEDSKPDATSKFPTETWTSSTDTSSAEPRSADTNDDVMCLIFVPPQFVVYSTFRGELWVKSLAGLSLGKMVLPDAEKMPAWNRSIDKLVCVRPWKKHFSSDPNIGASITFEQSQHDLEAARRVVHLASCGMDGLIRLWNLTGMEQIGSIDGPGATALTCLTARADPLELAEYLPSTVILASGSMTGIITVWDISSANTRILYRWQGHALSITCIESIMPLQGDGAVVYLVTGSTDCNVRLWTLQGQYIGCFGQPVPWDLGVRSTWRHPKKPTDVQDMVIPAELMAGVPQRSETGRSISTGARSLHSAKSSQISSKQSRPPTQSATAPTKAALIGLGNSRLPTQDPAAVSLDNSIVPSRGTENRPARSSGFRERARGTIMVGIPPRTPHTASARAQLKTADLLRKSYRTWYARSKFAEEHKFSVEPRRGRKTRLLPGRKAEAAALPSLSMNSGRTGANSSDWSSERVLETEQPMESPFDVDQVYHMLPDYELVPPPAPPAVNTMAMAAGLVGGPNQSVDGPFVESRMGRATRILLPAAGGGGGGLTRSRSRRGSLAARAASISLPAIPQGRSGVLPREVGSIKVSRGAAPR